MNESFKRAGAAALLCGLLGALAGCDRDVTTSADRALERTQGKLAAAGERLQPKLAAAGEKISDATQKTAEAVKDAVRGDATSVSVGADRPGAVTTRVGVGNRTSVEAAGMPSSTRAALGDTTITARIKAGLVKDPELSALKIDVDTKDGVVTLNGFAQTEAARGRAQDLARSVDGVREVRNHLTVKQG